jgi:hypothetical protein
MKIEPEVLKFLKGDTFQTSLTISLGKPKHDNISREAVITDMVKGTKVIHIGCSDHIQVINEKIKTNTWLHKLLTDNSEKCIGIDIDKESIDYIKNELGYKNVFRGDITTDHFDEIKSDKWDYAVFGELIEHLDNPVNFLKSFKDKYGENVNRFIITVPGIYNRRQFRNMLNYKEVINSDHRFWFTPYTISKVVTSAGFIPEKITYANLVSLSIPELISRKIRQWIGIKAKYPFYYFNTIIISGRIN